MKQRARSPQQKLLYPLVGILVLLAVTALLVTLNSVRVKKLEREAEAHRQAVEQQRMSDALTALDQKLGSESEELQLSGIHAEGYGLAVTPQQVGHAVILELLVLEKPGFAVIYSGGDDGGKTGKLLNASPWYARGVYTIVSIAAPVTLQPGQTYYAAIHPDQDGNRTFDEKVDVPLTNEHGEILVAAFVAQEPA